MGWLHGINERNHGTSARALVPLALLRACLELTSTSNAVVEEEAALYVAFVCSQPVATGFSRLALGLLFRCACFCCLAALSRLSHSCLSTCRGWSLPVRLQCAKRVFVRARIAVFRSTFSVTILPKSSARFGTPSQNTMDISIPDRTHPQPLTPTPRTNNRLSLHDLRQILECR